MLAVLRIVTGLLFLEHGTQKLFGFPSLPPNMNMPLPVPLMSLMGVGGVLELVGGLLIFIGLFTRPVAFILAGEMAVAYFMFHLPQSIYPAKNMGDAAVLFCFIFLFLFVAGPGTSSFDGAQRAEGPAPSEAAHE
jgi:putative oxidoreductase